MRTHIDILHARIGKKLAEAPANTVHVVLHRQLRPHTQVAELLQGSQRSSQGLLVGQLIEVEVHGRQFNTSLLHPLLQALDLCRRAAFQILADRPGRLTGPAKLSRLRIIVRQVAIVQRIVDVAQLLLQDLHLRAGIADVGMRMLHEIHLPMSHGSQLYSRLLLLLPGSQCQG